MKMSQLFTQTRREAPAESDLRHYQHLVRAGYIQPLGSSAFALLPLGRRAVQKMAGNLLGEMKELNPLEVQLPLLQPLDLWQNAGGLAGKLGIRPDQNPFPAPSQDATFFELARAHLRSYRQLPALLYHAGATWDASPSGGGLLRSRTPFGIEIYTLEAGPEGQTDTHEKLRSIFERFFEKLSLPALLTEAVPAGMAGGRAWQWFLPMPGGLDRVLQCSGCGYAAAEEAARFRRDEAQNEAPLPLEKVATPDCPTIEALARFLGVPEARTAKAVFLAAERHATGGAVSSELIFCVVRGDRPLNERALLRLLDADALRPAEEAEIRRAGAVPGYASPVGLADVKVIVDQEIPGSPNLVSGANENGFHLLNVNYGRDYRATQIAEIAQARAGDACPECGRSLQVSTGAAAGEMMWMDPAITQAAGCTFINDSGQSQPLLAGRYRLPLTGLLAALAELHQDEHGLKLPPAAAPYPLHLVLLAGKTVRTEPIAEEIYASLCAAGLEPLFDDRPDSPGVKFNDADLIGLPLRLTVGERGLQKGGVEFKRRSGGETGILPLEGLVDAVRQWD